MIYWFISKICEEHEEHLWISLRILREHQLYAKFEKYDFWLIEVKFLWHVIFGKIHYCGSNQIEVVLSWKQLRNVTKIWSFLRWRDITNVLCKNCRRLLQLRHNLLKRKSILYEMELLKIHYKIWKYDWRLHQFLLFQIVCTLCGLYWGFTTRYLMCSSAKMINWLPISHEWNYPTYDSISLKDIEMLLLWSQISNLFRS